MAKIIKKKFLFSFVLYSVSLVLCSALGAFFLFSHLYTNKGTYLQYKDLQKMVKGQPALAKRLVAISKYILPTVVNVTSTKINPSYESRGEYESFFRRFFNSPKYYRSSGSGFVIDREGHIVTNYHVVGDAKEVYVTFINHKTVKAEMVGGDPKTDIALLRIQSAKDLVELKKEKAFQVGQLGTSKDLMVGELVLAVGNPFRMSHSVSFGIISATGRSNVGIATYENFIQTDAAVNPGNSGGPLVSVKTGKIIGINTAILSKSGGFQGIAFTIPIDMARKVLVELRKKGKVERGYLGVSIQNVNRELARLLGAKHHYGVLIRRVYPASPADRAGLKVEDIIIEFNHKKIESVRKLQNAVAMTPLKKKVSLKIDRKGKVFTFQIAVQPQKSFLTNKKSLGLVLRELPAKNQYGLKGGGLLVEQVRRGSPSARVGLRSGQIITEVNGKAVKKLSDFEMAVKPFLRGKRLLIKGVDVDGVSLFYAIIK